MPSKQNNKATRNDETGKRTQADPVRRRTSGLYLVLAFGLLLVAVAGWWWTQQSANPATQRSEVSPAAAAPDPAKLSAMPQPAAAEQNEPTAEFIGMQNCVGCHAEQAERFTGSHHDLAMQESTENSVLGDFDDAVFEFGGVTTRFFRRGADFMVSTADDQGAYQDYIARYTFGVYPLQQYLLALPGGRYQAFSVAWDARPKEEGGSAGFSSIPNSTAMKPTRRSTGPGATSTGT